MGTTSRETTGYENLKKSKTHRNQTSEDYFQQHEYLKIE